MRIEFVTENETKITIESGESLLIVQEDLMPLQAWGQGIEDMEHKLIKIGTLRVAEQDALLP